MADLFTKKRTIEQATIDGNVDEVTFLLERHLSNKGKDVNNALLKAAYNNQEEIMKILLEHGADVNKRDQYQNCTALMIAVKKGFTNCVELLLKYGSRVHNNDISLTSAFECKCSKIVEILLDQGANIEEVTNKHGEKSLLMAAEGAMGTMIKRLIKRGMNIHAVDPLDNSTALHKLLKNLKVETLDFEVLGAIIGLIGMGIDINQRDKDGRTPLMIALTNDFSRINEPNVPGSTPNVPASTSNVPASTADLQHCMAITFNRLLSKCSNLNDGNNNGITPLMLAADNGYEHHVRTLIKLGCHIDQLSCDKWTALRFAVKSCHTNIVKLLLEIGANPSLVCNQVFEEALHRCHKLKEIMQLLLYHGIKVDLKTLNKLYMFLWNEIDLLTDMYRYGNCSSHSITQWIYLPEFAYHWHTNQAKTAWLLRMCSRPRSLQSLTRLSIRQCTRKVNSLPIPQKLKQYLNYEWDHDIFDQANEELMLASDETLPKPDSEFVQKEIEKREQAIRMKKFGEWADKHGYF